jgi:hypothetical protein
MGLRRFQKEGTTALLYLRASSPRRRGQSCRDSATAARMLMGLIRLTDYPIPPVDAENVPT